MDDLGESSRVRLPRSTSRRTPPPPPPPTVKRQRNHLYYKSVGLFSKSQKKTVTYLGQIWKSATPGRREAP